MVKQLFLQLEWGVYCIEKALLLLSVFLMAGILIFDVLQRMGSHPSVQAFMRFCTPVCVLILLYYAVFGRTKQKPLLRFALGMLVFIAFMFGLNRLFPTGFVGSQQLALGIMIWSAFLGASLAVRHKRHIMLSALTAKVSPQMQPIFALTGSILTALFCFYLAHLGTVQLGFELADWDPQKGTGEFEGLAIPLFVVTLALVVTPLLLGMRFLVNGAVDHFGLKLIGEQT